MQTEINITLGKNEGYMPSSLGGKSISVGRQAAGETKISTLLATPVASFLFGASFNTFITGVESLLLGPSFSTKL